MSDNNGINPNIDIAAPVETGTAVEVSAGENFTSFDALDKMLEKPKKEASKAPAEKKAEEKEEQKEPVKATEEKETKKPEENSGKEPSQTQEQKTAPTDDNLQVEVTVDGKKEQVSLKDLKNHYSGKVAWDKKFTELDKERKSYLADKEIVEQQIETFFSKSQKDPKSALLELCDIAGVDSVMFMKQLRAGLLPEMQKLAQMTDVERKAYELEEENNLLKKGKESEQARIAREQEQASLMSEINRIQETYKLDSEAVKAHYKELKEIVKDPSKHTPAKLEEYIQLKRAYDKVTSTLETSRPELIADNNVTETLVDFVLENPDISAEDINDIIEQVYGKRGSSKGLKKKVESAAKAEGVPLKSETIEKPSNKNPNTDPLSFDDLE